IAIALAVGALAIGTADGVAVLPVALPITLLAPKDAILPRVTALGAIVVAKAPATVVTSPVRAGNCAAGKVPVSWVAAIDLFVKVWAVLISTVTAVLMDKVLAAFCRPFPAIISRAPVNCVKTRGVVPMV